MFDTKTLVACGVAPTQAATFAQPLNDACERFDISTPQRQAAFLSQVIYESRAFCHLEEDLYYRKPERIKAIFRDRVGTLNDCAKLTCDPEALANHVYANRFGNGGPETGDGFHYRGAGLIQLTFRENHERCARGLGREVEDLGDYLRTPEGAAMSAGWYWHDRKINDPADALDLHEVTRRVNAALEGYADRASIYSECLAVLTGGARTPA